MGLLLFIGVPCTFSEAQNSTLANYQKTKTLTGYPGEAQAIAFSPDGKLLVIGTSANKLVVFNTTAWQMVKTIEQKDQVTAVTFSPDGRLIASGGRDERVYIINAASGEIVQKFKAYSDVDALAFNRDGSLLAVACDKQNAMLWDVKKNELARDLSSGTGNIQSIAFSPDGSRVAGGNRGNKVIIWDTASGREIKTLIGHSHNVRTIAYSPNGKFLVSGGADNTVIIWDANTGELRSYLPSAHANQICSLAFVPKTSLLSSGDCNMSPFGGGECKVNFWDVERADKPLATINNACSFRAAAFSPNARFLATANAITEGHFVLIYELK